MRRLKLRTTAAPLLGLALLSAGCFSGENTAEQPASVSPHEEVPVSWDADEQPSCVYYEILVRSFYDTDGDGIGDLKGVTEKLDYLQELGVGGLWLMPITESPSYHGYDVTDYYRIDPDYGTMEDLRELIAEAHKRDIKEEMVLLDGKLSMPPYLTAVLK